MAQAKKIHEGFSRKIRRTGSISDWEPIPNLREYIETQLTSEQAQLTGQPKIMIGTDSKFHPRRNGYSVTYITIMAFTFGRRGTHLIMRREAKSGSGRLAMESRLWHEVEMTIELAKWIREEFAIDSEIHIDINPKKSAKSNVVHDGAIGFGQAEGFRVLSKPDSPVAACAADHFIRGKF